ncbi:CDP-glycerol glycerophosphotransferase family protein [Pseudoalteromonas haloplanktis]|uniref:CDP-glycerol glycerophosphotransferase family protein n=1 Tax=Pseudoalteromonas haloplanktis TaxID=228 RepID=A0ABU1BBJ9_PSEHA|nr:MULTISPECIES: CDP-glycerol glycerophosphotransferase family protein [Pseudoalteromonas]MDQ9091878.1 CDP-glycerol glycerophosphotransferase family protein [Pseudoalteromonas haloplanktis]TMN73411.1 CDP-glycerol--glycerophosphate glycerophosphotransferase [Pseudoalteromonas sp. S1727]
MPKHYLFYVEQPYSFAILRPIQAAIKANGDKACWFITKKSGITNSLLDGEKQLHTIEEVKNFNPCAVFVPGNVVPDFFPGVKVQVFHGLEYKKKGHFAIRGFFDLYCTHGPLTTEPFRQLAKKHGYFRVTETGWPKLDPYFDYQKQQNIKPVILYAPTFSPNLSSLESLFEQIKALASSGDYDIKLKFHPKTKPQWQQLYQSLAELAHFEICQSDNLIPLIQHADVVISDTSSAVDESLLLGKPVITFNNSQPQDALINITKPEQLSNALAQALTLSDEQQLKINQYITQVHPFTDGNSAQRVLAATAQVIEAGVMQKPLNLLRRYKIRKALNYMKLK